MNLVHNYEAEYIRKLIAPEGAAGLIKSGDTIAYGGFILSPIFTDGFIAKRVKEDKNFRNVKIMTQVYPGICQAAMADPTHEQIYFCNAFFGPGDRFLHVNGLCDFVPTLFHEFPYYLMNGYFKPRIVYLRTTPLDKNGFFNFGISNAFMKELCKKADLVVVETNSSVPYCYGGFDEALHISEVDYIVESDNSPLLAPKPVESTDADRMIANLLIDEIHDGSCIQLGIGGMPNVLGSMLAKSGLKDLGIHTEMFIDAFVDLHEAGCVTNAKKKIYPGKSVYTFAFGSQRMYDFLDNNPSCASYPVHYVNDPAIIARIDDMVSINNAMEVDLYGQVSSESDKFRQVTGTGGQLDFVFGAGRSNGGKSFICLTSTYKDKEGNVKSRLVPTFAPGTITSVPRSMTNYVVTEYGVIQLKGKSTWERADAIIGIAHPDFRDSLIAEAEKMNIWKKTNRIA